MSDKLRWADDRAGELLEDLGQATSTPDTASSSDIGWPGLGDIKDLTKGIRDKLAGGESETATGTEKNAEEEKAPPAVTGAGDLTPEMREKIDLWLGANGYNRYGDPEDTYYTGGTPLFNEMTGEAIDRYEYILEKHPDILSKI